MSSQAKPTPKKHHYEKKKSTAFGKFVGKVIFALILGFLIGFGINSYCWHKEGFNKTMQRINAVYQQEIDGLSLRNERFAAYFAASINLSGNWLIHFKTSVQAGINKIELFRRWKLATAFSKAMNGLSKFMRVCLGTIKIVLGKLAGIVVSIWIYIFASLLGMLDGLLKRYVRTQEGGRESTFVFHKVSNTVLAIPAYILAVYLVVPLFINPAVVACVMAVLFYWFFSLVTSNLKKFV